MDKKKPGSKSKQKLDKQKANIIKRNIENVKNIRNKSKENLQVKDKPKTRSRSEKAKKKEIVASDQNAALTTFDDIKSPIPPNKISPTKAKISSTPIIKAEDNVQKVEISKFQDEEKIEDKQIFEAKNEDEKKEEAEVDESNKSPVQQTICVIKPSSVKRRRNSNELDDHMIKSIKKSL